MSKTHLKHIGKNIARIRESKSWSQQDLGDKINTSRQGINNIEKGRTSCSINRLVAIAEALDCNLDISFTPRA